MLKRYYNDLLLFLHHKIDHTTPFFFFSTTFFWFWTTPSDKFSIWDIHTLTAPKIEKVELDRQNYLITYVYKTTHLQL